MTLHIDYEMSRTCHLSIINLPKHTSITQYRKQLHWLPVKKRVIFNALTVAHSAFYKTGSSYLLRKTDQLLPAKITALADDTSSMPPPHKKRSGVVQPAHCWRLNIETNFFFSSDAYQTKNCSVSN